jgi:glycosyltransferase involved in cell wall biosynthesis
MAADDPPIVFLTPVLPASRGNGLAMRAGLFLEGMSRRHAVTVVVVPVFGTPPPDGGFVAGLATSCVTLELMNPGDGRTWPSVLLATAAGRRRALEIYPLPSLCRRPSAESYSDLRRLAAGASLVHVTRSYLAPCLDFVLDGDARPPITLDLDELDSGVYRQLGSEQETSRFERLERHYLPCFDRVYTASEEDARMVSEDFGVRGVSTIVNAVHAPPRTEPVEEQYDLLFVGTLSYNPNIDAVRWLCEDIRPLLGPVTIAIVGSDPGPEVCRLAELPGVTVAADVPDVTAWYLSSRVAIAPLRVGGGSSTKIAEALAHGRPVVATGVGASGFAVGEDHGVLVAGTAMEFAAACRRMLNDAPAASRIGAAGRRRVVMAEHVAEKIDRLTRSAIEGRSVAARTGET